MPRSVFYQKYRLIGCQTNEIWSQSVECETHFISSYRKITFYETSGQRIPEFPSIERSHFIKDWGRGYIR